MFFVGHQLTDKRPPHILLRNKRNKGQVLTCSNTTTFIYLTVLTFDTMKTIQVSDEFHSYLTDHGQFKETFEHILIRLIGVDKMKTFTGDRPSEVYDKKDVDSKKTKRREMLDKRLKEIKSKLPQKTGGKS